MIKDIIIRALKTPVTGASAQYSLFGWGDGTAGQTDNSILTYVPYPVDAGTTWVSGSGGGSHTIALKSDGTLWSWGSNASGQLGDNSTTTRSSPVQIGTLTNWSTVSAGGNYTISVKTNGTLWGWGSNVSGQLGDNTTVTKSSPIQIGTLTNWSTVSGGGSHTVALKSDGTLWGWGGNVFGQIGDNSVTGLSSPIQIGTLTGWSKVSASDRHSMAIKTDNTLWAWGTNTNGELGNEPITPTYLNWDYWSEVDGGYSYTMGIKGDGSLWGWGIGSSGQLGIEIPISPIQVGAESDWSILSNGSGGNLHSMVIKTDGSLWGWGSNTSGELGNSTVIGQSSPVQIGTDISWSKVSVGNGFTIALKTDGTLWAWGLGTSGQLGQNEAVSRSSPIQIGTLTNWSTISAGASHSMSIKTDGTLWSWGSNSAGQLGLNIATSVNRSSPVQIGTLTDWSKISTGTFFTIALKTNGTLWGWGSNASGQLGDNTVVSKSSPIQIGTLSGWSKISAGALYTQSIKTDGTLWGWGAATAIGQNSSTNRSSPVQIGTLTDWLEVSAGGIHTVSIKTDNTLWAWGANNVGQLGIGVAGAAEARLSPVQIGTLTNWSSVFAGSSYTLSITSGNTLYAWGDNGSGQLGRNHTITFNATGISSPSQVGSGTDWSKISTANGFTIGKKTDGTLWSWGSNANGALGLNDTSTRFSPVQIGTATDWNEFSSFNQHTMAIKTNGALYGWGLNTSGELGNITVITRSSPVQIGTLTNWSKVSTGGNHSLSVKTDGTLWAWGLGTSGRLGDNTTVSKSSPVQVGTLTNWSNISAGLSHSMAIKTDGTLWGWGGDGSGELGIRPVQPTFLSGNWSSVFTSDHTATDFNVSFGIRTDGTLWAWGANTSGALGDGTVIDRSSPVQIGTLTNWLKLSTGHSTNSVVRTSTYSLKTDGTLWAWGRNQGGELGLNNTTDRSSPVQIGTLTDWSDIMTYNHTVGGSNVTGGCVAIKTDGTLWGWGRNPNGQIGDNTIVLKSSPIQVGTLTNWAKLAENSGASHTMAIKTDGTLWGWGFNGSGRIGDNTSIDRSSPVQIGTLTDWYSVSVGYHRTMAIKTDGTLWVWGLNAGEFGLGNLTSYSSPVQVGTLTNWSKISVGTGHALAIKTDGTLWGAGVNTSGQLGDGSVTSTTTFIQIGSLTNWSKISTGQNYSIATLTSGDTYVWGANYTGELGLNTTIGGQTTAISSPIQIGTKTNWSDVWATSNRTYATRTDGTLWGWGAATNYLGDTLAHNIGIGTFPTLPTTRYSPVQIGTKTTWSSKLGRGQNHIVALKTDDSMLGWGLNVNGQLGLNYVGSNAARSSPVQIGDDGFWSEVAAGQNHTLAVKTDGTLWAWGTGAGGRIGEGGVISRSYPVQIGTLTSWSKVNANVDHSLAITTAGNLWGWGTNTTGKMGDGTIVSRSSPVQLPGSNWKDVNGNNSHSIAITTGGGLYTWGLATSGQLGYTMQRSSPVQIGMGIDWSQIDAGDLALHTMGVKTNGTLWGWGANGSGQLGNNAVVYQSSPVQIGTLTNWSSVNLSLSHTMAIKTDYTLWGWGRNGDGQLGDGTVVDRSSPVQIGTASDWSKVSAGGNADITMFTMGIKTDGSLWGWGSISSGKVPLFTIIPNRIDRGTTWSKISAGTSYTMAIKTDGTLWGWGRNGDGQLGDGTVVDRSSPVQIGTLTGWSSVSAGSFDTFAHTIAIRTDGTMWAWGQNSSGQLGQNNTTPRSSPVQIGTLTGWEKAEASKLSIGGFNIAKRTDGTLWSWGYGLTYGQLGQNNLINRSSPVQIGTLTNWYDFAVGSLHTIATKTDGTLWAWGWELNGVLGIGNGVTNRSSPVQVGTLTDWYGSSLAAAGGHSMAVKTNGTLWVWGGAAGTAASRLGLNDAVPRSSPIQVGTLTNWSKVAAGAECSYAVKTDGTLWSWGLNGAGQLGDGTTTDKSSPIQIGTLTDWTSVTGGSVSAGGSFHAAAIRTGGSLYAWALNTSGQLGLGHTLGTASTTTRNPVFIELNENWSELSLGADHGMAIKTNGTLWGWGVNSAGQIGDNTVTTRSSPTQIGTLTGWSKVSAGASHSMAIYTDGTLWAWGLGTSGQLGYNPITPSRLTSTNDWSEISGGTSHTMGVKTDGTLWTWGVNGNGQLGQNNVTARSSPTQVGTLTNWSKVSATTGASSGFAIKTDGTIWGWGLNSSGQLGDGTTVNRSSPVQIGTLTNWSSISTIFSDHVMAIKTDGTLWGWGNNASGRIGDGTTVGRSSPVQIGTLTNWSKVSAGIGHTTAIKGDGTLWSWGTADSGVLGDNTISPSKLSPIQIGTDTNWYDVNAGGAHVLSIKTDGTLWGWGTNGSGQLGDGTVINRSSPVQIGTLTTWSKIFAGSSYSMAIKTDGTLWGWGINANYQLGLGVTTSYSSPVQIGTDTTWSKISGGGTSGGQPFSLGIKSDNSLWGWGIATSGQLARGVVNATTSLSSPIQIGEDQWSSVYAGNTTTAAIKTDGTLWAWGVNTAGILGDTTVISRSAPVQIGTYSKWTQVSSGASHTIAIREE